MSGIFNGTFINCPNCKESNQIVRCAYYSVGDELEGWEYICLICGLKMFTEVEYLSLIELNEEREKHNKRKLKKLPKQR